jgi:dihydroorotase
MYPPNARQRQIEGYVSLQFVVDTSGKVIDLGVTTSEPAGVFDKAALRAGLLDGTIDAICSNHSPVDDDAKQLPFAEAEAGATGIELLLPLVLKWAEQEKVPLLDALSRITINPAQLLGQKMGHLSVGAHADICIFDPETAWKVEPAILKSQGKNTPFNGYEMQGRVRYTLLNGQIVFQQ